LNTHNNNSSGSKWGRKKEGEGWEGAPIIDP
jgi:hypothetical protein